MLIQSTMKPVMSCLKRTTCCFYILWLLDHASIEAFSSPASFAFCKKIQRSSLSRWTTIASSDLELSPRGPDLWKSSRQLPRRQQKVDLDREQLCWSIPLWIKGWRLRTSPWMSSFRKRWVTLMVALFLTLACYKDAAWAAVSSGRAGGGSFGPSTSTPTTTMYSRSSQSYSGIRRKVLDSHCYDMNKYRYHHRAPSPPRIIIQHHHHHDYTNRLVTSPPSLILMEPAATRFSARDVAILTGTGLLLVHGFANNHRVGRSGGPRVYRSPLGRGATWSTLQISLHVPNRREPNILSRLRDISDAADTRHRQGVQNLVHSVALELMRQEAAWVSARTQSTHYDTPLEAQREFQHQSVLYRSKFDRESYQKFGGLEPYTSHEANNSGNMQRNGSDATEAIITLHLAIEGDSTLLPAVTRPSHVMESLARIASDALVADCLLSAEVLWAPDLRSEVLSRQNIFADYPDLVPL